MAKAADQGYGGSQFLLGMLHATGQGAPQDHAMAYMWFNLAAEAGMELAQQFRDELAKNMTPAQIAEAQRLAREWMAKHKSQ